MHIGQQKLPPFSLFFSKPIFFLSVLSSVLIPLFFPPGYLPEWRQAFVPTICSPAETWQTWCHFTAVLGPGMLQHPQSRWLTEMTRKLPGSCFRHRTKSCDTLAEPVSSSQYNASFYLCWVSMGTQAIAVQSWPVNWAVFLGRWSWAQETPKAEGTYSAQEVHIVKVI